MKLILVSKMSETPDVCSFVLKPLEPIDWQAGQFMTYTLTHDKPDDRGVERWFTISSAPFEDHLMITTRLAEKSSSFKQALFALKSGNELEGVGPEGDFVVDDATKQYIFVAGGIGITPFHSILKQLDHEGQPLNVTLLYANRDERFIFKGELEMLSSKHPEFNIKYFVGDHKIEETDLREQQQKQPKAIFYISGPEPMVEHYVEVIKKLGLTEDQIKTDYFPNYDFVG